MIDFANIRCDCKVIRAGRPGSWDVVVDSIDGIFVVGGEVNMGGGDSRASSAKIYRVFGDGDSVEVDMYIVHMVLRDS